jgi:NhaP-type Na+/H+ or K+/H+ antiporter
LDKLLGIVKVVVEYAFGMHIGFALGWVIGLYTGYTYVEHFEPVYMEDLSEIATWRMAPFIFARNGTFIGIIVGIIAIAIINSKSRNECKSDEHTRHLCHFISSGHHVNNEEDYKDLIKTPRYKCFSCGHTANDKQSICQPLKL